MPRVLTPWWSILPLLATGLVGDCVDHEITHCHSAEETSEGYCKCIECESGYALAADGLVCEDASCNQSDVGELCEKVGGTKGSGCYCSQCPLEMVPCHTDPGQCCASVWCGAAISDPLREACADVADDAYERALPSNTSTFTGLCTCQQRWICSLGRCSKRIVRCEQGISEAYDVCTANASAVGTVCRCSEGHECTANGTCLNRCKYKDSACDHYESEIETDSVPCSCLSCAKGYSLSALGQCLPSMGCGQAATDARQCPSQTSLTNGRCECVESHYCDDDLRCQLKLERGCGQVIDLSTEVCGGTSREAPAAEAPSSIAEVFCACPPDRKCNNATLSCETELLPCGAKVLFDYQVCPTPLEIRNGVCTCPLQYSCGGSDNSSCVLTSCAGDVVPFCDVYRFLAPRLEDNGLCLCRKCRDDRVLESGLCDLEAEDTTPAPGAAQETVTVAVLRAATGDLALFEKAVLFGAAAAVNEINEAGGLLGKRVLFVDVDTASSSAIAGARVQEILDSGTKELIVGCTTVSCRDAVVERLLIGSKVGGTVPPFWYTGASGTTVCHQSVFSTGVAASQVVRPAVVWTVETLGKRTFFLLSDASDLSTAFVRQTKVALQELELSYRAEAKLMDRNYNEALTALIKALPDGGVVFNFLTGIDNAGFFQALAKLEYKLFTVVSFFAYEEDLKSTGSVYMEGSFCVASFSNSAGDQPFKASVVAASAGTLSAGEVSERAYDAYLAVKLWAMSVRRAGSFSSELMSKLNDISVASPTGNRLHVTSSHQVSKTIVMLKVTGGALVPVAQTMTPSWPASNECKFSTYSSCALSTDDVSTTQALAEGACVPFASVSARGGCVCGAGRMCTSAGLCVRRGRGCGQSLSPGDFCKYYGAMTVNGSCVCKDALVCDQGHCKINDSSRSAIVSFLVSGVPRSTLYSYGVPTRFALSLVEGLTTRLTSDLSTTAELRRICDVRRNRTFDCVHAGELSPDNVHSGVLPASFLPVGDTDVLFGRYSIQFEFHLWPSGDHAHDVARQFVARFASGTVLEGLAETSLTVIHSSSYVKSSFGFRSLFI